MRQDWVRLADELKARRVALSGHTNRRRFLRERLGRDATESEERHALNVERGKAGNYEAGTIAWVEYVYGWQPGSIASVLSGRAPQVTEQVGDDDVEAAILADPTVTERDKRIMLELRRSMQAAAEAGHSLPTQGRQRRKADE